MITTQNIISILKNPNGRKIDYSCPVRLEELNDELWQRDLKIVEKQLRAYAAWSEFEPPVISEEIRIESINNFNARLGVPF